MQLKEKLQSRACSMLSSATDDDLNDNVQLYFLVLFCLVAVLGLIRRLTRSDFGQVIRSIRINEVRMQALGFATFQYRLVCYVISGMICGLAGWPRGLGCAGRGRCRAAGNGFLVGESRFAQVGVDIDKAGGDDQSPRLEDRRIRGRLQVGSALGDAALADEDVAGGVGVASRIDDAALAHEQVGGIFSHELWLLSVVKGFQGCRASSGASQAAVSSSVNGTPDSAMPRRLRAWLNCTAAGGSRPLSPSKRASASTVRAGPCNWI